MANKTTFAPDFKTWHKCRKSKQKMNTKTSNNKNLYATWVDSQKKMIDSLTESTQKFTKDETVNNTIEKGSALYKNWLDNQLSFMNEQTDKMQKNPASALQQEEITETAKNWMKNQMELTKSFMDFSMNTMKEYMQSLNKSMPVLNGNGDKMTKMFNEHVDTFKKWSNTLNKQVEEMLQNFDNQTAKNAMAGMFNQTDVYNKFVELWTPVIKALQTNNFNTDSFNQLVNPAQFKTFMDKMLGWNKEAMENYAGAFNLNGNPFNEYMTQLSNMNKNWMNLMQPSNNPANDMMQNWMKFTQNQTGNDWMKNWMPNSNQNPMEMMQQWMQMFQTASQMNQWANQFQKSFGLENFQNDWTKNWNQMMGNDVAKNFSNMQNQWMDMFKNFSPSADMFKGMPNYMDMFKNYNAMDMFKNISQPMDMFKNLPAMNGEVFENIMKTYTNMFAASEQAFGPMFRMMMPNATKANMELMKSVMHKMNQYQIKNAEMQYMTYEAGVKAMQEIGNKMQDKMAKAEGYKSMNTLYTEWLNTSDKALVALYESDAYSKIQAEVAALAHGIKKDVEVIMEKMMVNIPVITRTEMDDTYKTIYDLKKRVKELERSLESKSVAKAVAVETEMPEVAKAAPTKSVAKAPVKKTGRK